MEWFLTQLGTSSVCPKACVSLLVLRTEAQFVKSVNFLASLVAQTIKNLPAMQETCVQSLGWEDLLEENLATQSVFLLGESPWTEEPGGL